MENKNVLILKQCIIDAHETFEATMVGVTPEVAHFKPAGKALPIGALYAHMVISEDWMVKELLQKKKLLLEEKFAGQIGLSQPMPDPGTDTYEAWAKNVTVDLVLLKEYATAVYQETNRYMDSLNDTDLVETEISFPGDTTRYKLSRFIVRFIISHIDAICGEISALKGIQGLKGYPF